VKSTLTLPSLLSLCLFSTLTFAQVSPDIEFGKIKQKKIRSLMLKNDLHQSYDFEHLQEVCTLTEEKETYSRHTKTFYVHDSIENVWKTYCTISPKQSWCGKMVSFGTLFNSSSKPLIYANDPYEGLKVGQILFIQLKLFKGLYKLAVAHKVTGIDAEKKLIQICYLKNGASAGSQYIKMRTLENGYTEIVHETFYRSKSKFRDARIYPKIHEKVISEFHENVASKIIAGSVSETYMEGNSEDK